MQKTTMLSANTLIGDAVENGSGEELGHLKEIMLDVDSGRIAYGVLSFGGLLGLGDKLFAVPWSALRLDADNHRLVLDVPKEKLEKAPGFDKDDWPDFADRSFARAVHDHYGQAHDW